MSEKIKTWSIVVGLVIGLLFSVYALTSISYNNAAADLEVFVDQAKTNCAVTYDNGIKAIIEMAQVDSNTKEYLVNLIESASPEQQANINEAYGQFIGGNTQPFMLLMGGMAQTNFTATAENVQREISSQRSAMLVCATTLVRTQTQLKSTLGMDASGRVVKFPQTLLNLDYPSPVSDPYLKDNDGDGRLTVLDYRPPVDISVTQSFGTGDGLAPITIYPTPAP